MDISAKYYDELLTKAKNETIGLMSGDIKTYKTGIEAMDKNLLLIKKTFNIIASRSGVGKTRFCFQMIKTGLENGYKILYISVEDSAELFGLKYFEYVNKLSLEDILKNRKYSLDGISQMYDEMKRKYYESKGDVHFLFAAQLTLDQIINEISTQYTDFDIVIIDYIQGLKARQSLGVYDKHSYFAETLRELAITENKLLIAIAQLNRQTKKDEPEISNLLGSGFYEQVAHGICLLQRDFETNEIKLSIKKNRLFNNYSTCTLNSNYETRIQSWN